MLLRILLLSAFVGLAIPVSADRVWLNNGDRLSGDILLLDGGKRVLKTRYAGQVLIDWKDIDTLRSDQPLLLRRQELDREPSKPLVAAGKACCGIPDATRHTMPLASITRLAPPGLCCKIGSCRAIPMPGWAWSATRMTPVSGSARAAPGASMVAVGRTGSSPWPGRTASERHYLMGVGFGWQVLAGMTPVVWLELQLIPTVSPCSVLGLAHNARLLSNQSL